MARSSVLRPPTERRAPGRAPDPFLSAVLGRIEWLEGLQAALPGHLVCKSLSVEILVRGARGSGIGYWIRSLLGQLVLLNPHSTETEDRDAPVVLVRTTSGREHVLQRTGTDRQALRAMERFSRELDQLGTADFCRRYGLPETLE